MDVIDNWINGTIKTTFEPSDTLIEVASVMPITVTELIDRLNGMYEEMIRGREESNDREKLQNL